MFYFVREPLFRPGFRSFSFKLSKFETRSYTAEAAGSARDGDKMCFAVNGEGGRIVIVPASFQFVADVPREVSVRAKSFGCGNFVFNVAEGNLWNVTGFTGSLVECVRWLVFGVMIFVGCEQ